MQYNTIQWNPMKSNAIHSFESISVCACVQWFPPPIWLRPHWGIFYLLSHPPPYCNHHTIAHFHTHCSQCKFKNHIVASKSTIPTPTAFLVKTTMLTYLLNAVHCYAVIFSNVCFECIWVYRNVRLHCTSVPVYQCTSVPGTVRCNLWLRWRQIGGRLSATGGATTNYLVTRSWIVNDLININH